jgi:hypothetical protein
MTKQYTKLEMNLGEKELDVEGQKGGSTTLLVLLGTHTLCAMDTIHVTAVPSTEGLRDAEDCSSEGKYTIDVGIYEHVQDEANTK